MPFCIYSQELLNTSFTLLENVFIKEYIPDAPSKCVEVYVYGLYLCSQSAAIDNSISVMAQALSMDEDDIITAYTYWEEMGLVQILNKKSPEVVYLQIKSSENILKRIKPGKYSKFNSEMQNIICGRLITPNEFNEYYNFLETTLFQPEALVRVASYCVGLKGEDINYPYILTIARNLSGSGIKTLELVDEKLASQDNYSNDINIIFKSLSIKRRIEFEDKRLYEKWQNGFGLSLDVINHVAKRCKKGGMSKLDIKLESYYKMGLFSQKEIDAYENTRDEMFSLAVDINRTMGLYYASLDYIVEEYIAAWLQRGFDSEALKLIAKYCFKHDIKSFEGLSTTVDKFYKLGLISPNSIIQYVSAVMAEDEKIKKILETCGLVRYVSSSDRSCYKNWTNNWGFDLDVVLYVASLAVSTVNPISYVNKILSNFKESGIKTVEEAKKFKPEKKQPETPQNYSQRTYTNEQLNALFDDLDDLLKE